MDNVVSIKNVVVTFQLGRPLNLPAIAQALLARLDPRHFPALVTRCKQTGSVISAFTTGSVVTVGCQTEQHGKYSAWLFVETLQRVLGLDCSVYNFHVRNLVCRVKLPFFVNIELFFRDHGPEIAKYKPDMFPGMGWKTKVEGENVTFTLFFEGGGVATGLKTKEQIPGVRDMLLNVFTRYRLGHEYRQFTKEEIEVIGVKKMKKMREFYDKSLGLGLKSMSLT